MRPLVIDQHIALYAGADATREVVVWRGPLYVTTWTLSWRDTCSEVKRIFV